MSQQPAAVPGHAHSAAPAVSAYPEQHPKGPEPAAKDPEHHHRVSFSTLMLGAIGVVYGDIGTSPLYAMRETIAAAAGHGGPVTREIIIGVLSLLLWSLILTVTVKYVF